MAEMKVGANVGAVGGEKSEADEVRRRRQGRRKFSIFNSLKVQGAFRHSAVFYSFYSFLLYVSASPLPPPRRPTVRPRVYPQIIPLKSSKRPSKRFVRERKNGDLT